MPEENENMTLPVSEMKSQKNHNKLLLMVVVLVFLLCAATSWGIWGLLQGQEKDQEIGGLREQLANIDYREDELNDSEEVCRDESIKEIIEGGPYIDNGYFYVPEWKVKFKLSDELTDYGFAVMQDSLSSSFGKYNIGMSAVQNASLTPHPQARYYDDIMTCAIVNVGRVDKGSPLLASVSEIQKYVLYGDEAYVIYDYRAHGSCDYDAGIEQTVKILREIFSHPEEL